MAVELRHLRYFAAVADARQVSRAARELHIAQPALSQSLRGLERDVGVELLHRHARGVELTEAGQAFLVKARAAVAAADEAIAAARRVREQLVVGFLQFALVELATEILDEFGRRHPHVPVRLRELNFAIQTQEICEGRVDAAFLWPPYDDVALAFEPIVAEPRVVVLPADHPLAGESSVTVEEIADETFHGVHPSIPAGWADYWYLTRERGRRPTVTDDIPITVEETAALIASGKAITSGPASVARLYSRPGIAFVALSDVEPAVLALVYRPDNGLAALGELLDTVRTIRHSQTLHV